MKKLLLPLFLIILTTAALAIFDFNGFYENDLVWLVDRNGKGLVGDLSRARLRINWVPVQNINLHLEPEYNALIRTESVPITGVTNLDQLVWDRAYLEFTLPQADVTVGKQRIAWGAGYLWNPTDVFNPFTLSFAVDEEQEEEPEAIRVEVPFGYASDIDAYVVTNKKWEETIKGIRAKTNFGIYDLSASYVDLGSGSWQLGFDSTGELLLLISKFLS